MKERLELLLVQKLAQSRYAQPWSTLSAVEQRQLRSRIYREARNSGLAPSRVVCADAPLRHRQVQ